MQLGLFGSGVHPATGETAMFRLADRYEDIRNKGPASLLADLRTAKDAIQSPSRVFQGLNRLGYENGFALVAKPSHRFLSLTESVQRTPGTLFFVYIDEHLQILDTGWVDLRMHYPDLDLDEAEDRYLTENFRQEIRR